MDNSTSDVLKAWLASLIRHGLTAAGLFTGVNAADQANFTNVAAGMIMVAAGLGWSYAQKFLTHKKLALAQISPARPADPVAIPK